MLGFIFARFGATVLAANDADELVALAMQNEYELALVDLDLARGAPQDLVRKLHQLQPGMTTAITYTYATPETLVALRADASGIVLLPKPFALADVRRLLRQSSGSEESCLRVSSS